jgi:tape measure domain-containing protein
MATISNTITLRDRMSSVIERISDRMRRLDRDARISGRTMTESAESMSNAFGNVGSKIVVLASAVQLLRDAADVIGKITAVADEYSSINARLGLILKNGESLVDIQNQVYASAERSRGSYAGMASAVAKIGQNSAKYFNNSNSEIIAFTELLQKSFTIGGASATEMASGLTQISQALSLGKLQGDEFNSIMENASVYGKAIRNEFSNLSDEEFGKLKEAGGITAGVMRNAMFNAAEDINKKFANIPITFSQAWVIAKDKALKALQPLMQRMTDWLSTGGAEKLTQILQQAADAAIILGNAILWIVDNWNTLKPLIEGAIALFIGWQVAVWLLNTSVFILSGAFATLFAELVVATGGLILIAAAIGAAILWVYKWIESVGGIKQAWAIVLDWLLTAWDNLRISGVALTGYLLDAFEFMGLGILKVFQMVVNSANTAVNAIIELLNNIPGVNISTIGKVTLADDFQAYAMEAAKSRAENVRNLQKEAAERSQARKDAYAPVQGPAEPTGAAGQQPDWAKFAGAGAPTGSSNDPINTKVKGDVTIADEDLKYMREMARVNFVNKFTTLRPSVRATFGDISKEVDIDGLVSHLADIIETSTNSALQ